MEMAVCKFNLWRTAMANFENTEGRGGTTVISKSIIKGYQISVINQINFQSKIVQRQFGCINKGTRPRVFINRFLKP